MCVLIAMMCVFLLSKTLILAIENAVLLSYGSYLIEVVVQDCSLLSVFAANLVYPYQGKPTVETQTSLPSVQKAYCKRQMDTIL